MLDVSFVVVNA